MVLDYSATKPMRPICLKCWACQPLTAETVTTTQALGNNGQITRALNAMPNPEIVIATLGGNDIMNDRRSTNQI